MRSIKLVLVLAATVRHEHKTPEHTGVKNKRTTMVKNGQNNFNVLATSIVL